MLGPTARPSTKHSRHRYREATVFFLLALICVAPAVAASRQPARGAHGMVVSPEASATKVGVETLRSGGNAVDAAIAVAFALSVTYPRAGSLGGGGFLLYRSASGEHTALDFREAAPSALRAEQFLDERGQVVPARSLTGGLAVGVPGLVAGLSEAHGRWGSRPWREVIRPAIRLADSGVEVSRRTAKTLADEKQLSTSPAARVIFFRDGRPLREGERLVQRDLARSLRRIAEYGARGFYHGETASRIVATVREAGGVMTPNDLLSYKAIFREPVEGSYRGYRVFSFPPPSSGGIVLLQVLAMLEKYDLHASGWGSSLTVHRMVEAERRAFADRSRWLGDPGFFRIPMKELLDPAYIASRAASIRDDSATPSASLGPGEPVQDSGSHTLHFSVVDEKGNAVSLTTTLNSLYGTGLIAAGTGILLNNEMDDFAMAPGTPNQFGLVGGEANAVAGGKRPLSSMSPTIVEAREKKARPVLVLGSPDGPRIISTVLEVISSVLDHGLTLQEAVDAPRFHHQWLPDRIEHERLAFSEDVAKALQARGHTLHLRDPMGNAMAIGLDPDGTFTGAPDPRDEGTALGY